MNFHQDQTIDGNSVRLRRSSASSLQDIPVFILEHLKCSICCDVLEKPVTTTCGHTFCEKCLYRSMTINDQSCPLCKHHLSAKLEVNFALKDILTEFYKAQKPSPEKFTGQLGEVPCDVCPDNYKYKAVKSCLICLISYCSKHLICHSNKLRFKGHRMVAPLIELDQRACMVHAMPLELYSINDGKIICSVCLQSGTNVVSVEEEKKRKQTDLDTVISEMKQRVHQRKGNMQELNNSAAGCLALIDQETDEIKMIFNAIKRAVQKAEDEALLPLENRRRQVEQEVTRLKRDLEKNIDTLSNAISDMETVRNEEDPIFFLQNYPTVPLVDNGNDWSNVCVNTDLSFGTIRSMEVTMMADIKEEFEKLSRIEMARIKKFGVEVTLDPETANAQLIISDDKREVRSSVEKNDVPDSPMRFDVFGSILGQNCFFEGRAFWMVEVGNKRGWDIGVVREEANRKGSLSLKPSQGYWIIVYYNNDSYAALEDPPTLLSLSNKPHKVGVFVDYEENLVSFYDMEAETHIYSFTDCAFGPVIRPYFSPHINQDEPLVICPVNPSK